MIGVKGKQKGIELVFEEIYNNFLDEIDIKTLQQKTKLSYERVYTSLSQLQHSGIIVLIKRGKSIYARLNPFSNIAKNYFKIIAQSKLERLKKSDIVNYSVMNDLCEELGKKNKRFVLFQVERKDNFYKAYVVLKTITENNKQDVNAARHHTQVKHSCHIELEVLDLKKVMKKKDELYENHKEKDAITFHGIEQRWDSLFELMRKKAMKKNGPQNDKRKH